MGIISNTVEYIVRFVHDARGIQGVVQGAQQVENSVDKLTNKIKGNEKANQDLGKSQAGLAGFFSKLTPKASDFTKALSRVLVVVPLWMGFREVLNLVGNSVTEVIKSYTELEKEMGRVATVTVSVGATLQEFNNLQIEAIQFLAKSSTSAKDTATAMYQLATAGLSVTETQEGFKDVLNLSIASMTDIEQVGKMMSGAYKLFGDQLDATMTTAEKFQRISDVIGQTFSIENVEVSELATAFGYAAAEANSINFSFEELVATLGFLNTGMLKGSKAGTSLTNVMLRLATESEELEKLTGKAFNPDQPVNYMEVMTALHDRYVEGKLDLEESAKLTEVFGLRGKRALLQILQRWDEYSRSIDRAKNTQKGFTEKMRKDFEFNIPQQLKILQNRSDALWLDFGQKLESVALPALSKFNKVLEGISIDRLANAIFNVGIAATTLGNAIPIMSQFDTILKSFESTGSTGLSFKGNENKLVAEKAIKEEMIKKEVEHSKIKAASEEDMTKYLNNLKSLGATDIQLARAKIGYMEQELGWGKELKVNQEARLELQQALNAAQAESAKQVRSLFSGSLADALKEGGNMEDIATAFSESIQEKLRDAFIEAAAEGATNLVFNATNLDAVLGNALNGAQLERSIIQGSTIGAGMMEQALIKGSTVAATNLSQAYAGSLKTGGTPGLKQGIGMITDPNTGLQKQIPIAPANYYKSSAAQIGGAATGGGFFDFLKNPKFQQGLGSTLLFASLFGNAGSKSSTSHAYSTSPSSTTKATTAATTKAYVTNVTVAPVFNLPESVGTDVKNLVKATESAITPLLKEMVTKVLEAENISSGNV